MNRRPRLLVTLGDVAGIGPEVLVRAWSCAELHDLCTPIVVGDVGSLRRAVARGNVPLEVVETGSIDTADQNPARIPCLQATTQNLALIEPGRLSSAAGRAAFDFLCAAIDLALGKQADGIVTLPLQKEALHAAGISQPGHTEILAERTRTTSFGMMLYYHKGDVELGVTHVTLHMALRDVFRHLTTEAILEKIRLTATIMERLIGRKARVGVFGLNPHASDGGLFGNEEATMIAPAVRLAREQGIEASGPWPGDSLFNRAVKGHEFDGLVAMYHDQGHIAMKTLAGYKAVNITLGLPIIRTSVAHGTAFDIAGKGIADPRSLIEAVRVAAKLA